MRSITQVLHMGRPRARVAVAGDAATLVGYSISYAPWVAKRKEDQWARSSKVVLDSPAGSSNRLARRRQARINLSREARCARVHRMHSLRRRLRSFWSVHG